MNKTAIKNFSVWARTKLIKDVKYKAGLVGITENGIKEPLPQSVSNMEFYDIGTKEPYVIQGIAVNQRKELVKAIKNKEEDSDYKTAYNFIMEEVAYTWFNRLIAIRFMEVNDYLPSKIRVLSSESGKFEPDIVSTPFDAELEFSVEETEIIRQLKYENKIDELFQMLFIKQCNALNDILPKLFEKTNDFTELLLNISIIDKENSVVYRIVNDIPEEDFDVEKGGQVEIIGWLYQSYISEPKDILINARSKYKKNDIPFVTQIFTSDWIVQYMVDNSLGKYWIERNPNSNLKNELKYFVTPKNRDIKYIDEKINPEEITFFDPCMGSGHILVYAFDVLMKIYRECGYNDRDAVQLIVKNNLFGLDIDKRAFQLTYFSIMMKARSLDRRFLTRSIELNVYVPDSDNDCEIMGSILKIDDLGEKPAIPDELTLFNMDFEKDIQNWNFKNLLTKKYCIICTNPPYINSTYLPTELKSYIEKEYKDYKSDIFAVFIIKCLEMCKNNGYVGMLTPYVWMFISSYEKLRKKILNTYMISSLVQLEYNAFEGACVPVCSFVIKNTRNSEIGEYIKLSEFKGIDVQAPKTLEAIKNLDCNYRFTAKQENFSKIPGSPIAYWASETFISVFNNKHLYDFSISPSQNVTGNNSKYVRKFWELNKNIVSKKEGWIFYAKGGGYRKWWGNLEDVVNWTPEARQIYQFGDGIHASQIINKEYWYKKGVTWGLITSSAPSFRVMPEGATFDKGGSTIIVDENVYNFSMGLLNSKVYIKIALIFNPTLNFQVKDIRLTPLLLNDIEKINNLVNENISLSKTDWDSFETSWDFEKHPLVSEINKSINKPVLISDCFKNWENQCNDRFNQLKSNEEELNRIFIEIYGLQDELTPDVEDKDVTVRKADLQRDIKSLLSYAVGCMFGRYSPLKDGLLFAGGQWDYNKIGEELFNAIGKNDFTSGNMIFSGNLISKDNIIPITDDEYIENDIVTLLCKWLKAVFGEETFDQNIDFIANALGNSGKTPLEIIRNYFIKDFFKDHCKIYQKRPIYWLFDSGKQNGFKALIYLHRYNADTIGNVRIDYLHHIQRVYESEINRMQENIENGINSRQIALDTKRKEKLIKQLKECRDYDENISHLALSRIELDLDDGVKVNYDKLQTASDGKFYNVLAKI